MLQRSRRGFGSSSRSASPARSRAAPSRPAAKPATPARAPAAAPPAPMQQSSGGGMLSGIGSTIAQVSNKYKCLRLDEAPVHFLPVMCFHISC